MKDNNCFSKEWLDELHKSRLEDLVVFKKPQYINVFNGVIDKYSDSAHFIYELLQNADDARATEVNILLEEDKFIFSHNGTIKFTVSDPKTEPEDRENNKLGHINSITAIGFSSKTQSFDESSKEIKIGKFGVGFKAIFQYTTTPYIYDSHFCFKIEDYIVPTRLSDTNYQQKDRTVFVIPFDRSDISAKQAYEDIENKIGNLKHPQLFLFNVRKISWQTPTTQGKIEKKIVARYHSNNGINSILYRLQDENKKGTRILLFSREVEVPSSENKHTIAIGYFINDRWKIDTDIRPTINCFFPTQEKIDTCYIVHAPFALVDNRQQIKKNNEINDSLLCSIGELAADSLVELRDISLESGHNLLNDNIFELMSYNLDSVQESYSYSWYRSNTISFKKYYEQVIDNEAIFLSKNKKFISKSQGWWADTDMQKLLSSEQLNLLTKLNHKNQDNDFEISNELTYDYILCSLNSRNLDIMEEYGINEFSDEQLSLKLSDAFLNRQGQAWLNNLYAYILEKRLVEIYRLNSGYMSKAVMRHAKIIKTESGHFIAPYQNDNLCVFFNSTPDNTIDSKLYSSCGNFKKLIELLGVKVPSVLDEIRIKLDQQSELNRKENNLLLAKVIKFYYSSSFDDRETIQSLIENNLYFRCRNIKSPTEENLSWELSSKICDNSGYLFDYYTLADFEDKHFLYNSYYEETVREVGSEKFNKFISELNLTTYPEVLTGEYELSDDEYYARPTHCYNRYKVIQYIEGIEEVLNKLKDYNNPKNLSHFIWDMLVHYNNNLNNCLFINDTTEYKYYYTRRHVWPTCTFATWLRELPWLYIDGSLRSITEGTYQQDLLAEAYVYDKDMFTALSIDSAPNIAERESIKQMSEETKEVFAYGDIVKQLGITSLDELTELIALGRASKQADYAQKSDNKTHYSDEQLPKRKKSQRLSEKDFVTSTKEDKKPKTEDKVNESVGLEDTLAGFEEKINIQKEELENVISLRAQAESSPRYSFAWFRALMDLETKSHGQVTNTGKRSIHLYFDKVYTTNENTRIILTSSTKVIPPLLEDIDGIPVTFYLYNGEKQLITFDNASIKEDSLILRSNVAQLPLVKVIINNIKYICHATIEIERPIELIKQWQSMIYNLPFTDDSYSLKTNLRKDLKFIFGPPGTGKTTLLAKRICDKFKSGEKAKILVLTPTNKACDVLTEKILSLDNTSLSWICRFVSTMSEVLENNGIVYQRDSNIITQSQVCVISTIARYAFDGFDSTLLKNTDWDLVILDEASMIPLYQIIPVLYSSRNKNVWITGDPFQIDPIVNIDTWKDENIYKMIDLKDFGNPRTSPHKFDIELLMTQYRSIPIIGEVYSQYMYSGRLKHERSANSHRVLNMGLKESPLNIISFPVSKNSIFDTKRLSGSNIHIYSVIFTIEFLKYITDNISKNHPDEFVKIGVLSPYGIQIQSIKKLYNQTCTPYENISVDFGTSHGFQGDQCDIILAVMNPPASGMVRTPDLTFINRPNILNVAISRAKDYLYVLIPGKEYDKFDNLFEIKKVGKIMISSKNCTLYTSDEIEKNLFGESRHIENNTFVTAHQTTNIYSDNLAKYEVRIDDNAIDIQVNKLK